MNVKKAAIFSILLLSLLLLYFAIWQLLKPQDLLLENESSPASPSLPYNETTLPQNVNTDDPDTFNIQCVKEQDGSAVSQKISISQNYVLSIEALVNTSEVERVALYQYNPVSITDAERTSLFKAYFQEKADDVYHYTEGNADAWVLMTDNEQYLFGFGRGNGPIDEPLFTLRNATIGILPFNMLNSISDAGVTLSEAFQKCSPLICALVPDSTYEPDCIRPFLLSEESPDGYLWITYRKVVDGIPITANYDLRFYVTNAEVICLIGTLYQLDELTLDQPIISLDAALSSLSKYALLIDPDTLSIRDLYSDTIPVTEISFEYIVLRGYDFTYTVTPVWRFLIGSDEDQRLMHRDKIIAVNALTGELILERRGLQM